MDRGAWWSTVHGGRKVLGTTEHMYNNKIISVLFVKVRCLRSYLFLVSCLSNFLFITMYPENRDEIQLSHTVICIAQCKSEPSVHWGIIHAALITPLKPCQPGSSYPRSLIKASARQEGQGRSPSLSIHAFIAVSWAFCLLWFCMTQESLSDSSPVTPSTGQRQEAHSSLGVPSCSTFKVRVPLSDPYFSFLEKRIG